MSNKNNNEKKEIKSWLKMIGKDREWLAEKCSVEKSSVDGWFAARRNIPKTALAFIRTLMHDVESKSDSVSSPIPPTVLPNLDARGKMFLQFDEEAQKKVFAEAARLNMDPSTYCTLATEWCCDQPNIGELLLKRLNAKKNAARTESVETFDTGIPEDRRHLKSRSNEENETA